MKKFLLILIIFSSFLSLFLSCDDSTGPPNNNAKINLTLEDVSCTEVWLKLEANNPSLKNEIILYREEEEIKRINLINNDTIIFDEDLLPNKTYTYQAIKVVSNEEVISSEKVSVTTMDTTSHNFTWETYTFGEAIGYNSVLYDVAIIDENNIWAVGEIYMNDSLGNPDPHAFNCVHWDGKIWEPRRIYYYGACSAVDYPPLKAIWAFSKNNIVITNGGSIGWFDGNKIKLDCGVNPLLNGAINKIWGTSSNDLYVVGNSGSIAHYQNGVWRKIENGTDVDLLDVWGSPDGNVVFFCGYTMDYHTTTLLKYNKKNIIKLFEGNPDEINNGYYIGPIKSLWGNKNNRIYIMNWGGIYVQNNIDTIYYSKKIAKFSDVGYSMRGTDINDIWISGQHGLLGHYNGNTYKEFSQFNNSKIYLYSIAVKDNIVCTVGYNYSGIINNGAIIHLIKKNN